ncbi:Recombinase zinc beta ribbon domain-containing protein [Sulfitobacter brevis]|uniref:Recombinase zinc beta ribbon domain-containing protein n=2 Tax=Sulfitobacter brevis TaxID=74348 RepID=A0A1I2FQK6_9RHOB|nr:Recombinase zinc beta ribbon domain-containing protein [Sulfitobacter brevis]
MRQIFKLFLEGDGLRGPMGIKAIVNWLNERGYRTRSGKKWGIGTLHRMLRDPVYSGTFIFHSSQNGGADISVPAPEILHKAEFEAVQQLLTKRNPQRTPPRVVTGPVLLTGLAKCPHCTSAMTMRTGKGGSYKYYACSNRMRTGPTSCVGRSVPMYDFDALIMQEATKAFVSVGAIKNILAPLAAQSQQSWQDIEAILNERESEVLVAKRVIDNLYQLVQNGLVDIVDPDFKKRFSDAKVNFDQSCRQRDQVAAELLPKDKVDHTKISDYVSLLSEAFQGNAIHMKKGHLRALVDEIIVGEETITISGRRSNFENAIKNGRVALSSVPTFVRVWRSEGDSN